MKRMNNKETKLLYFSTLRELLRKSAVELTDQLSRSVARITSCEDDAYTEYTEEVRKQHALAEKLLYLQQCRDALEQCIENGSCRLRYTWSNGKVTVTRFKRVGANFVTTEGMESGNCA